MTLITVFSAASAVEGPYLYAVPCISTAKVYPICRVLRLGGSYEALGNHYNVLTAACVCAGRCSIAPLCVVG